MAGSLVVSIVALAMSALTLTWQVIQFRLGASRVFTELRVGASNGPEGMTAPVKGSRASIDLDQLAKGGYTEQLVAVQVQNRGRLAVSVTGWSIVYENGGIYSHQALDLNKGTPLPHRLDPGAEATWVCSLTSVQQMTRKFSVPPSTARARVTLGNGKTSTSRNYLDVKRPLNS